MGWAVLVSALQALLKKSDSFEWNADCDTAFDGLRGGTTTGGREAM